MKPVARWRFDAAATVASLLALVAWEASGADLVVTGWVASSAGFAWRDNYWLAVVLHGGGRVLAWCLLALLVADVLRPFDGGKPVGSSPPRRVRAFWLAVVLATAIAVPSLKRFSQTSCPWDLAAYGGANAAAVDIPYVPHWLLGVADGGPGHCFPSGHAAGVLAFIGLYFLWRGYRPAAARYLAATVWTLGAVYGATQVLRGAHFVSHVLWAAWLCWVIAWAADAARAPRRRTSRQRAAAPVASNPGASRPQPLPPGRAACAANNPAE